MLDQQKISKGCIIAAFNTDSYDYIGDAVLAGERVNRHLNLPVTIITDVSDIMSEHDVITVPKPADNPRLKQNWYNMNRTQLYDLSPYDRTLLIDSDYFICTDTLSAHMDGSADFIMAREVYNPVTGEITTHRVGESALPMYWATVTIFNKSAEASLIFELAKHIQKHWEYYSAYYRFRASPMRNDYIFSIACHLAGGYGQKDYGFVNYPLVNCDSNVKYTRFLDDQLVYEYAGKSLSRNKLTNMDLHLMNKDML